MSLKDSNFKNLKPKTKRYEVGDRDGLFLEVLPSGQKTWRYRYRLNGRREKLTIGPYPAISLKDARERRNEAERLVVGGTSPAKEKQVRKQQARAMDVEALDVFAEVAERWRKTVLAPANKNARQDETYLIRDILPRIGTKSMREITTADVWTCIDPVVKNGCGQAARRVRSVIKRVFELAQSLGIVSGNPAQVVRPTHIAPTKSRRRVLTDDEIRMWHDAVYKSGMTLTQKLALHFLLLVPVRKGELMSAEWTEVDFDRGTWDIPAAKSKTGAPIRHQLPAQALVLLKEIRSLHEGSIWVLPSPRGRGRHPYSKSALNSAMREVPGLPAGLVIHDLRRTIRTGMADLGIPEVVAELCLNHRKQGVGGIYDRSERLEARTEALQRWADHIDVILVGRGKVTRIDRHRAA